MFSYLLLPLILTAGVAIEDLPPWITNNPGVEKPREKDSIKTGNGSLSIKGKDNAGWVVFLNEKSGHGVEVDVEFLSLDSNSDDFLLISKWRLNSTFKQVKLYTGSFNRTVKKLRIPNTKTLYVLYSSSSESGEMILNYRRYGISLEVNQPTTDRPIKKKETVFEVQLRGKSLEDYSDPKFLMKVKESIRAAARRYSIAYNVSFNESIPTEDMVVMHRISFCPFEWPDRDICASLEHSVFVSGVHMPNEDLILDYQLTADHLKVLWDKEDFPELWELGITVFQLPSTNSIFFYWAVMVVLVVICSFFGLCILCKASGASEIRKYSYSSEEVRKVKRPKMKLAKLQRVPSFMYLKRTEVQKGNFPTPPLNSAEKDKFEDVFKPVGSSELPIKNYFGSILFSSNRAFEDDEDKPVELRPQSSFK